MKKINLILLAAGDSERFGKENKLITQINDVGLIEHALKLTKAYEWNKVTVVTKYQEVLNLSKKYGVCVAWNIRTDLGLSYSIKIGLDNGPDADAFCFMVCDQPYLTENTVSELINLFNKTDKGIACVKHGDITGNPVIFDKKYFDELKGLKGDVGGKVIVNQNWHDVEFLEVANKNELIDIDYKPEKHN